jgi:hypothetical protein
MMLVLHYAIVSTALWYLGSRALITQALWSRYPPRFARFMDCSACCGFWWGLIYSILDGGALDASLSTSHPIIVGLCMIVMVPLLAGLMQRALWEAGSAADVDSKADEK